MSEYQPTERQREAIEYAAGPLMVLAGPGTGKTSVIVRRIAHMIEHRGIVPEKICAITFTNKAADEVRERIGAIVSGTNADAINAGTFHRFGRSILHRFADLAGLPPEPMLLDSAQRKRMLRALIHEHGLFAQGLAAGMDAVIENAIKIIGDYSNAGKSPEDARQQLEAKLASTDPQDEARGECERLKEYVRLYALFEQETTRRGFLTLDDLITRPTRLLRENSLVKEICRSDYPHLVVDEFQDLNRGQIEFLEALCGRDDPDLCVVGDDDQAIYAFRGADQFAFRHFENTWPNAKQIKLEENWRSGQAVLDLANAIIEPSETRFDPSKTAKIASGHDAPQACVEAINLNHHTDDGVTIAAMILLDRQVHPDRSWSDYAVIARHTRELDRIQTALEFEGIPTQSTHSPSMTIEPGVQDIFAWITTILEPDRSVGIRRLLVRPPFGLDSTTVIRMIKAYHAAMSRRTDPVSIVDWLEKNYSEEPGVSEQVAQLASWTRVFRKSAQTQHAGETIDLIISTTGLIAADLPDARARLRRIEAVISMLRFVRERLDRLEQPRDLAAFLSYYNELDSAEKEFSSRPDQRVDGPGDEAPSGEQAVQLLTAHAAKGLEFDTVFLPRVESNGYICSGRKRESLVPAELLGIETAPPAEEERRIFYVACTRAERRLVLLAKMPNKPGKTNYMSIIGPRNLAIRNDGIDFLKRAADAELGRFDTNLYGAQMDFLRDASRQGVLARVRHQLRTEAALALDSADRARFDQARVEAAQARLESAAIRLAIVGAAESDSKIPNDLDEQSKQFARRLQEELESKAESSVSVYAAPTPPLSLSYTSIHTYQICPRCYYVQQVLGLPGDSSPAMRVGTVVHDVLESFTKEWRDAESEGNTPPEWDRLESLARNSLSRTTRQDEPVEPDDLAKILSQLKNYHDHLHDPSAEPIEVERMHSFTWERDGHAHRINAKIDRIDRIANGIRIIDYKTGKEISALSEPKPDDLQLGLYALAAMRFFESDQLEGTAEYWLLSTGNKGIINLRDLDLEAISANINSAIDNILAGKFERSKKCRGDCAILDGALSDI